MAKILVVDDEKLIVKGIRFSLEQDGMEVDCAYDGEEAINLAKQKEYDVVLLDVMLPKFDGFEVCQAIREFSEMPIIMLTAKGGDMDKILGLEYGADDYITKPFNPRELTIRARNLLSRTMNLGTVSEERRSVESYKFNGWELDINSRSLVSPNGEQYKLPRSEFRAMLHFCENPGKIQSRAELLKKMTGRELKPHDRTVDVTIRRIRKHFESTPDTPEIIATIHGEGYRFCGDLQE